MPTLTAERMPKSVPACRAKDLTAEHRGAQGAGGWWTGGVSLTTHGARCLLIGFVELRFIDAAGREMVRSVPAQVSGERDWAVLGEAQVLWWWGNWCRKEIAVGSIIALLPNDPTPIVARVDPPMSIGPRCDNPSGGTTLSTGPVRPWPTQEPIVTTPPASLAARIDAPPVAIAGETLRYVVTLTNLTPDAVSLDPCPSYIEWLGGHPLPTPSPPPDWPSFKRWEPIAQYAGFRKAAYRLNCAGVREIAPRQAIAFEMRIDVPADGIGADTLRWSLQYGGVPNASAPIRIERR